MSNSSVVLEVRGERVEVPVTDGQVAHKDIYTVLRKAMPSKGFTAATQEQLQKQMEAVVDPVPFDARFPNQNQTRACFANYVDYHRCVKVKGEEYEPCNFFKNVYESMCPKDWVEQWDELRGRDAFMVKI